MAAILNVWFLRVSQWWRIVIPRVFTWGTHNLQDLAKNLHDQPFPIPQNGNSTITFSTTAKCNVSDRWHGAADAGYPGRGRPEQLVPVEGSHPHSHRLRTRRPRHGVRNELRLRCEPRTWLRAPGVCRRSWMGWSSIQVPYHSPMQGSIPIFARAGALLGSEGGYDVGKEAVSLNMNSPRRQSGNLAGFWALLLWIE